MMEDAMDLGDKNEDADDIYNSILGEIGLSKGAEIKEDMQLKAMN